MTYKEHMELEFNRGIEQGIRIFIEDKLEDNVPIEKLLGSYASVLSLRRIRRRNTLTV